MRAFTLSALVAIGCPKPPPATAAAPAPPVDPAVQAECSAALGKLAELGLHAAPTDLDQGLCQIAFGGSQPEGRRALLQCQGQATDLDAWRGCHQIAKKTPAGAQVAVSLYADKAQVDRRIQEGAGVLGALREGAALDGVFGSSGLNGLGSIGALIGSKGTGLSEGDRALGGAPVILGALDKAQIDAVIQENMGKIRECYARALGDDPTLAGKLVVKFVVSKDGSVASASKKSSTLGNAAVETCINARFLRMQFPAPTGGGIVIVSYPFVFSPG